MEDLIKIAANGQWTLEKAKKPTDAERKAAVEAFMARRAAQQAANPSPQEGEVAPPSPTMRQNSTAGLRPAQPQGEENPNWGKEQVAAFRAGLPASVVDKAGTKEQHKAKTAQEQQQAHGQRTQTRLEREQAEADAKAKATQGRKAAWEATAQFLGDKGENKGYASLAENMQQRKLLDQAHAANAKGEAMEVRPRLPPMAPVVDPKTGVRSMQPRQGTFHGEGATTTGKIKSKGIGYPDKETGEMKYTSRPQVEKHHWSWDHNFKKWNHVKTTLENPTIG